MDLAFFHYKPTLEYTDFYFTIEEQSEFCNVQFKKHFARFITKIEQEASTPFLYGVNDLNITEKLHHQGFIDIVKIEKVFVSNSLYHFKNQAESFFEHYYDGYEYMEGELPFKTISIAEEELHGEIIYIAHGIRDVTLNGFYVDHGGRWIDNGYDPKLFCKYFLHENLYCKKDDFQKLYQLVPEKNMEEIKEKFLNCFEEGKSILYPELC